MKSLLLLLALTAPARAEEGPQEPQAPVLLPGDPSSAPEPVQPAPAPPPAEPAAASETPVAVSTPVALSTPSAPAPSLEDLLPYGVPLDASRGPWLIGETLVRGNPTVPAYTVLEGLRARRGALYTPTDMSADVQRVLAVPGILSARAEVYAMREEAVPENYLSVTVSSMMARVLFVVEEKPTLPGLSAPPAEVAKSTADAKLPRAPVSGVVLTPTAYRGAGRYNTPGLGFDVNAAYYIGRLYGKNSVSARQTNFIDRLGLWFLTFDGKAQIQSEGEWRPAVAVGGQGTYMIRDSPQPSVQTVTLSVDVDQKTSKIFSGAYFVASKKIYGVRSSLGFMHGNAGEQVAYLSEFLSPQSLQFLYLKGAGIQPTSKSTLFGSLMLLPKPSYPLAVEFFKPNGMPLNPILFNFKLGYFLKLNFDLAYLRFQGGWDMLGTFQFRFNQYPRL